MTNKYGFWTWYLVYTITYFTIAEWIYKTNYLSRVLFSLIHGYAIKYFLNIMKVELND
jgi:hypothetical protein